MKYILPLVAVLTIISFNACNTSSENSIDTEIYSRFERAGDEVSNNAQAVLLENVGAAVKKGGSANAVSFCNLNASSIVDSLNKANNCRITRVSARNRSPENYLQSEVDKQMWKFFSSQSLDSLTTDTLVAYKGEILYYRPIKIGMSACLMCHGIPGQDIDAETSDRLEQLYPADLATGYKLNDFRGLWKIHFQKTTD